MITVHHLNNSRSQRILWMLEELGLAYEVKRYERYPETMAAPEALKQVHALGKAPVITDSATGRTLAESGTIIEYLAERYGSVNQEDAPLLPAKAASNAAAENDSTDSDAEYWDCKYWLHYAEGSLMTPMLVGLITGRLRKAKMPFFVKPVAKRIADQIDSTFTQPRLKEHFKFIESHLAHRDWFSAKHLTVSDIQMSFPLEAAASRGLLGTSYPNINAFVKRVHARPAYQAALKRGGEYDFA
ncbi:MAG: glutathione S-transferase [Pseudomonadota bacterium]|nr:glutathione S-transferase [Pseudomonadota bacterium]MDQ3160316.1 glutathione S-transferase [Pseudomonadota bacterium]